MFVDEEAQENDENQENEEFKVNLFWLFAVFEFDFNWLKLLRDGHRAVILVLHWLLIVKV